MLGFSRLAYCFAMLAPLFAVTGAEVRIDKVEFSLVDQAGVPDPWYEIAIMVSVEQGDRADGANPRFADDLGVSLAFATESEFGGRETYAFYGAEAEYATLEVGRHVVRFYLQPEIVKRDRVKGEPFAYEVQVFAGEAILDSLVSRNLGEASRLESFRSRSKEAGRNGLLRLQRETPFRGVSPRDTPNAKRRAVED